MCQKGDSGPLRIASTSQSSYSGTTRSGVVPGRTGRLSACCRIRRPFSTRAWRSVGLASAALELGAPVWKIQFMNRSSKAPPCLIPLTPQFDTESIGTIVVSWGGVQLGQGMLSAARITRAEGAHLAVGPFLTGDPLHDVIAVLGIIDDQPPGPLAGITAPHVVGDHDVPAFGVVVALGLAGGLVIGS